MKEKNIKLFNRYNSEVYLEYVDNTNYYLKGDLDYMRIIYSDDKYTSIEAVDPSGGPYIAVNNFRIHNDEYVLTAITQDYDGDNENNILLSFKIDNTKCKNE